MITLQQLLMTDSDLSGSTQTGKAADGAQDFLALLAGALTDGAGQGKDAPLTLADLKTAGSKLAKAGLQQDGDSAIPTKLADLLARQDALTGEERVQVSDKLQTVLSGLLPTARGDALKTLAASAQKDESKTDLNDEELAGLSALMAMLPHQQQTATAAAPAQTAAADSLSAAGALSQKLAGRHTDVAPQGKSQAGAQEHDSTLSASAQLTPVAAAAAAKQDAASSVSSSTPTATLAPVMATPASSVPAATVAAAPVVSQPLGTHEWQQAISQHVTLFTKQGQQSAELRLHPEDLGQVHISLKLEDNQAQLQMVSAHSQVRAALEAALPTLRTQLAENGIQLTQSNISSDSSASQQQQSFSQQQQHASRSGQQGRFNDDGEELLTTPAALQSAARGNGSVDIFA